ncbi:VanZ family protein [Paenibacillus xylanexedens]|uniref:VanZ family protein n=1 Tax=Paenibacillus xylanexedens TaxID=528191 RepID=UPI0011A01632|nr:VanZ family protein [Paenibacillus xylanexedens]
MRQNKPNEQYRQQGQKNHQKIKLFDVNQRHKSHGQKHNRNEIKSNPFRIVWIALFVIYLYLLTKLILFKGGAVDAGLVWDRLMALLRQPDLIHTRTVNLTPFQEIKRDWHSLSLHRPGTAIHLAGNILVFVPFGIWVTGLARHSFFAGIHVLFLSFLLSLGYEVTQLLTGMGIFDVDDLMLNTIGGMIGYVLYIVLLVLNRLFTGGRSRVVVNN